MSRQRNDTRALGRQRLFKMLDDLPRPEPRAFLSANPPPLGELPTYRIVDDRKTRQQLVNAGLADVIQSPGPGNWKKAKPSYILRIYPNFDAPKGGHVAAHRPGTNGRTRTGRPAEGGSTLLPTAIVHDLRSKWESYYQDTRPENQRRHEQRAQSIDPTAISSRAKELIAEGRRANRTLTSRDAILQATDELTSDFETALRRKHGDIIVEVLGIPDATDGRPPD